jgi:hypothetical protein
MTDYEEVKADAIRELVKPAVSVLCLLRDLLVEALKDARKENGD